MIQLRLAEPPARGAKRHCRWFGHRTVTFFYAGRVAGADLTNRTYCLRCKKRLA